MKLFKLRKSRSADAADAGRRSFIWKFGAGVSTGLASTAGVASVAAGDSSDATQRAAELVEEKALRQLHQSFEQALDQGRYDDVIGLFAADAEVVFNGGVFENRRRGLDRLFRERFSAGRTGARMEPAPGFELAADQQPDNVEVATDLRSAKAAFAYSIRVGKPIETDTSLASMARQQGDGVQSWWEGGIYHVAYRRDTADGQWQISRLEYETLSRADYRSGRTWAGPLTVGPFAARYPEDPLGPDALA